MMDFTTLTLLAIAALLTSAFTAALGQGGGLMLMPVLAGAVPSTALIPVHGFIQTISNGSRALLILDHVHWPTLKPILWGILIGSVALLPLVSVVNWTWMQAFIGVFILYLTWGGSLQFSNLKLISPAGFFILGLVQGGLGMIVGATGPLGSALLLRKGLNKDQIVATNACIMLSTHILKVVLFAGLGIAIWEFWPLLLCMSIAAIAGSYLGNALRHYINERLFVVLFKTILTLLALRMIAISFH